MVSGPVLCSAKGELLTTREIDRMMHEILEELFEEDMALLPPDIKLRKIWWKAIIAFAHLDEHRTPEPRRRRLRLQTLRQSTDGERKNELRTKESFICPLGITMLNQNC